MMTRPRLLNRTTPTLELFNLQHDPPELLESEPDSSRAVTSRLFPAARKNSDEVNRVIGADNVISTKSLL